MLIPLTASEATYFYPLLILVLAVLVMNIFSSKYYKIWSPLTIVAITYLYYTIIGPALSIYSDETFIRLVDHRPFFATAWKGALLSLVFIIIGYNIFKYRKNEIRIDADFKSKKYASRLYIVGVVGVFLAFGFSSISGVNFLSGDRLEQSAVTGGFQNYFLFMMNLFVPAATLMLLSYLKKDYSLVILILGIFYAAALYTSLGFRYRVVLIILSLLSTYHLFLKKKPNYILMLFLAVITITAMGVIGSTRSYFSGLRNTEAIADKSFVDLFLSGFNEAQTFQSTGLLIENVPKVHPHVGLKPIYETLAMPIPRQIWPGKPSGESLESVYSVYQYETGIKEAGTGAAILNFGEHYSAYGWVGIALGALILGMILKRVWAYYLQRKDDYLAIALVSVFNSFIYVVISRGYLPQVTINFFFTVVPILILIQRNKLSAK